LLAINGTGIITVVNASDKLSSAVLVSWLFIFGIVFALLNGWLNQRIGFDNEPLYVNWYEYWSFTEETGRRLYANEQQLSESGKWLPRLTYLSAAFGWISAILFLFACGFVTSDLADIKSVGQAKVLTS